MKRTVLISIKIDTHPLQIHTARILMAGAMATHKAVMMPTMLTRKTRTTLIPMGEHIRLNSRRTMIPMLSITINSNNNSNHHGKCLHGTDRSGTVVKHIEVKNEKSIDGPIFRACLFAVSPPTQICSTSPFYRIFPPEYLVVSLDSLPLPQCFNSFDGIAIQRIDHQFFLKNICCSNTVSDLNKRWHATCTPPLQIMQSSVSFPRTRPESIRDNGSWISSRETRMSITNRDVALEVHDLVYGEPSTGTNNESILATLERLYEPNAGKIYMAS